MFHTLKSPWAREEYYNHFMNNLRCSYSLTVQIDVTELRKKLKADGLKSYPAHIYMLAATVNRFTEFRMALSPEGEPGFWDVSHPMYTVFNQESKTFSGIWTLYNEDFSAFYKSCSADIEKYSQSVAYTPKAGTPPNAFNVSSVPWLDFTALNMNVYDEGKHLPPIFTIGKYIEQDGKTLMPLAMQLHHAACDGYHAGQFVEALRTMAADCRNWINIR